MPRGRNYSADDTNLLRILKEKADQYGVVKLSKQEIALEYGISYLAITGSMERLSEKGYITYEKDFHGRNGGWYIIRLIDQNKVADDPVEEEEQTESRMRVCRHCGSMATSAKAKFCWNCGASLLTETELLEERITALTPRLMMEIKTPSIANEVGDIFSKIRTIIKEVANG